VTLQISLAYNFKDPLCVRNRDDLHARVVQIPIEKKNGFRMFVKNSSLVAHYSRYQTRIQLLISTKKMDKWSVKRKSKAQI